MILKGSWLFCIITSVYWLIHSGTVPTISELEIWPGQYYKLPNISAWWTLLLCPVTITTYVLVFTKRDVLDSVEIDGPIVNGILSSLPLALAPLLASLELGMLYGFIASLIVGLLIELDVGPGIAILGTVVAGLMGSQCAGTIATIFFGPSAGIEVAWGTLAGSWLATLVMIPYVLIRWRKYLRAKLFRTIV